MRPLLAALLLLPGLGYAQTITLTVNGATTSVSGNGSTTTSTLAQNASACSNTVGGNWVASSTLSTACTSFQIWLTAVSPCGTAPSTSNTPNDVVIYTAQVGQLTGGLTSDTFSFPFGSLPSFTTSGNACGAVVDFTNYLCAAVTLSATTGQCQGSSIQATAVNIRYDNVPPVAPIVTVTPLDSKLGVALSPGATDTLNYFLVQYAVEFADGGTGSWIGAGGNVSINNPKVTINNLNNGTNYLIEGQSVDEAGNVSTPSAPVVGTPVTTYGFYANYLNDGGQVGCGAVADGRPSAVAFATLLLLGVARRRG